MSTQYRDPPQWKTNAAERLDVEMFARLNAASDLCDRFLKVANKQLNEVHEHVESGGDFLEALVGSASYAKMRAAADAAEAASVSGSEKAPASVTNPEQSGEQKEPASPQTPDETPKRKYMPRLKAEPVYVMALRAAELQRELIPILQDFGRALLASGVDIRRHLHPDVVAQVIRDEFGVELEEIDQPTFDLMRDTIVKTNEWLREFKQKAAEEMNGAPPGGEAPATDG
jgi:hypothetical protein